MTMKELSKLPTEELDRLAYALAMRGNMRAVSAIDDVKKYYHKTVRVVKGRKIPHGVTGECFWMGNYDNSKYGDPWGIYSTTRIGIKDADGNVFWTSLDNVQLVEEA